MSKASILIIDDEPQIRKFLTIALKSNEYAVLEAATGKAGLSMVANRPPDVVLLDLGLPDQNGHEVLQHLREWFNNPVIIISVQNNEDDIVRALDNGANDYLIKPFRTGELLARIRCALRTTYRRSNDSIAKFRELQIDFANRTVKRNNTAIKLTATEYALLALFAQNDGKVLTHHYMLRQIWGPGHQTESQYLRVFVAQLRKKIETDPNRPAHIITESGVGYRFLGDPAEDCPKTQ